MWDNPLAFSQLQKYHDYVFRSEYRKVYYPYMPDIECGRVLYEYNLITEDGQLTDAAFEVLNEAFHAEDEDIHTMEAIVNAVLNLEAKKPKDKLLKS